jgi:hypothetical protein
VGRVKLDDLRRRDPEGHAARLASFASEGGAAMSAYEKLVERCARTSFSADYPFYKWSACSFQLTRPYKERARIIIAEVMRELENVTPEMFAAVIPGRSERAAKSVWVGMLRASPLSPPKDEPR